MISKSKACAALIFVGYATVSYSTERKPGYILEWIAEDTYRTNGASEEQVKKFMVIFNKDKTLDQLMNDFYDVSVDQDIQAIDPEVDRLTKDNMADKYKNNGYLPETVEILVKNEQNLLINSFSDMKNNKELPLYSNMKNEQQKMSPSVVSTMGSYYTWFFGNKK